MIMQYTCLLLGFKGDGVNIRGGSDGVFLAAPPPLNTNAPLLLVPLPLPLPKPKDSCIKVYKTIEVKSKCKNCRFFYYLSSYVVKMIVT